MFISFPTLGIYMLKSSAICNWLDAVLRKKIMHLYILNHFVVGIVKLIYCLGQSWTLTIVVQVSNVAYGPIVCSFGPSVMFTSMDLGKFSAWSWTGHSCQSTYTTTTFFLLFLNSYMKYVIFYINLEETVVDCIGRASLSYWHILSYFVFVQMK